MRKKIQERNKKKGEKNLLKNNIRKLINKEESVSYIRQCILFCNDDRYLHNNNTKHGRPNIVLQYSRKVKGNDFLFFDQPQSLLQIFFFVQRNTQNCSNNSCNHHHLLKTFKYIVHGQTRNRRSTARTVCSRRLR